MATLALINRVSGEFGVAVRSVVNGSEHNTINIGVETGYPAAAPSAAYDPDGRVLSVTGAATVKGAEDGESLVNVGTQILVISDIVENNLNPFYVTSQDRAGNVQFGSTVDGGFTGLARDFDRRVREEQVRAAFGVNQNPLNLGLGGAQYLQPSTLGSQGTPTPFGNPEGTGSGADQPSPRREEAGPPPPLPKPKPTPRP